MNTLRQQGAVIYWVGLPKMESHRFDDGAQLINAVLAQHMAALGAEFAKPGVVDLTIAAEVADPLENRR